VGAAIVKAKEDMQGGERRCILDRESQSRAHLLRLVIGPDGQIVPDVAEKLPGRGAWVSANRAVIDDAVASGTLAKALSRAFKTGIKADQLPDDLGDRVARLMERRVLDRLGQLKRSGVLTIGLDKVRGALAKDPVRPGDVLLTAADGGADGTKRIDQLAAGTAYVSRTLDRDQLSMALGGDNVVHVLARASKGTQLMQEALARYTNMVHDASPSGPELG